MSTATSGKYAGFLVNSYHSQRVSILVNSYLHFGQLVPTFWSTRTCPSQHIPILVNSNLFWLTRTPCKEGGGD